MIFEVGDIVECNVSDKYCITDVGIKCTVKEVLSGNYIRVRPIEDYGDNLYDVDPKYFKLVERKEKEEMEEVKIDLRLKKERRNEIKAALNLDEMMQNGYDILNECEIYNPQPEGMKKIEQVWLDAKLNTETWGNMSLFEILSKHPNYVPEKGYIVFSNDWQRPIDIKTINDVINDIYLSLRNVLVPFRVGIYDYITLRNIYNNIKEKKRAVTDLLYYKGTLSLINISNYKLLLEDYNRTEELLSKFKGTFVGAQCYTKESYELKNKLEKTFSCISNFISNNKSNFENEITINEDMFNIISSTLEEIKGIRTGQKLNKVIGKILKTYGLDKHANYNSWLSRLGDACSPIQFTRHTIISLNRNDYWTMSYGDHWCSCANIDKNHVRESSDEGIYGDGCCSSGTESYMLDPSTVVMYTVDSSYKGNDFELQDKINRCLFHVGDRKFIMGRVYPQGTDGEDSVYKQWRETFQKVIADCLGVTNFWKTTGEDKGYQYYSYGTHYRDYEMDYCNVAKWSYLKETQDDVPSGKRMIIGHDPICPCCGEEHDNQENIQCCGYRHRCADCGDWHEEEDMHLIDGEWYCSDCVSYCDYHEEYEHEELTYVEGYGYVCDYALDGDSFICCDKCGEYFWVDSDDSVYVDDKCFCSEECAENAGYNYCYECSEWVSADEWDEDNDMCKECVAELEERRDA